MTLRPSDGELGKESVDLDGMTFADRWRRVVKGAAGADLLLRDSAEV